MFCRHCGNQVIDEAYVCPNCGCLVRNTSSPTRPNMGEATAPAATERKTKPGGKFNLLGKIFSIVGTALSSIVIFSALIFIIFTTAVDLGPEALMLAVSAVFGLYFMIVLSPFALTGGILAFVFGRRAEEKEVKSFSVVAFILGIAAMAVQLFVLFALEIL